MSLLEEHRRLCLQDLQRLGGLTYSQVRTGINFVRKTVAPRFGDRILVCDLSTNEYFFAIDAFEVRLYIETRIRDALIRLRNTRLSFVDPALEEYPVIGEWLQRSARRMRHIELDGQALLERIDQEVYA